MMRHWSLARSSICFKQAHNFWISRLIGKQLEGVPMSVTGSTKAGEALEESCDPFDISPPHRIGKVVELNRPPRRSRTELCVRGVDFRALLN